MVSRFIGGGVSPLVLTTRFRGTRGRGKTEKWDSPKDNRTFGVHTPAPEWMYQALNPAYEITYLGVQFLFHISPISSSQNVVKCNEHISMEVKR